MTKEEKAIEKAALAQQFKKFGKNSSESAQALQYKLGFVVGAKSQAAKEYWQKGMYSEEEVKELIYRFHMDAPTNGFIDEDYWFSQNKK